jgi:spore germination protein KB
VLVLGIEQTENSAFPAFALAKTINVGDFFQRVEGILITIWVLTFFIKISLLFLSLLQGLQSVFRLKEQSALIYPLAVMFIVVAWNTYINTVYILFKMCLSAMRCCI